MISAPRSIAPWLALLLYLAAAIAATWPLAADPRSWMLFHEEKFDGLGALWFGEHVTRAALGQVPLLVGTEVNWPVGLDLRLADSFLFGLLYLPFRWFLTPVVAFNAFALVAIASTGAAGFWMAQRALRSSMAGALAAGFILAFNSLMHCFRIEGEIYLLASLFLPLFAGALVLLWQEPSKLGGLRAGLLLGALAWSSGYFAVNGLATLGVLGVMFVVVSPGRRERLRAAWPGLLVFAVTAGVLLFALSRLVNAGNLDGALTARFPDGQDPLENVALDSVSLTSFLIPYDAVAHLRGTRIYYVGMAGLAMGAGALAMGRRRESIPWAVLAVTGLVLACGPTLKVDDVHMRGLMMPYAWLVKMTPKALAYRMPYRFLALTFVGFAALTAQFLTYLKRDGLGRVWRAGLLGLVIMDSLFFTGFAVDRTMTLVSLPAGYTVLTGKGAVLDVWAYDRRLLNFSGWSAFYQVFHGKPVLANFTRGGDMQTVIGSRLAIVAINGDQQAGQQVMAVLRGLGVSDIVVHAPSFDKTAADQLRMSLVVLARPARRVEDIDGGHAVEVYYVKEGPTMTVAEALALVDSWRDAS